ncbi:hypothetical protein D918_09074 [Trichuris suis]|nr:hypothetical protein D918_09074 [Trichuris suis]
MQFFKLNSCEKEFRLFRDTLHHTQSPLAGSWNASQAGVRQRHGEGAKEVLLHPDRALQRILATVPRRPTGTSSCVVAVQHSQTMNCNSFALAIAATTCNGMIRLKR